MLIKFTSSGRGGGGTVAAYLTDPDRAGREHAAPEVIRGDMDRTRALIDSITRRWTYTHGVLSFAPEDRPPRPSSTMRWMPSSGSPSPGSIPSSSTSLGCATPTQGLGPGWTRRDTRGEAAASSCTSWCRGWS